MTNPTHPRSSRYELEKRAMEAMARNEPAEALSCHTSTGVPPQLDRFMTALRPHLPIDDENCELEGRVICALDGEEKAFGSPLKPHPCPTHKQGRLTCKRRVPARCMLRSTWRFR